jgi:hypothetical protein
VAPWNSSVVTHAHEEDELDRTLEIKMLSDLMENLRLASSPHQHHEILDRQERVKTFVAAMRPGSHLAELWRQLGQDEAYLLKCTVAIRQGHALLIPDEMPLEEAETGFRRLIELARFLESFYDVYGGVLGYQITVLQLMEDAIRAKAETKCKKIDLLLGPTFHVPAGINLADDPDLATKAAAWGIECMPNMAEMYPVGGAGDRLGLVDEETGEALPAALLPYCGRTMIEGLVRDLQAREYLYYKLYGRQLTTPVAIMTSAAKKNHQKLLTLFQKFDWFGRTSSAFRLIQQSMVPVVSVRHGLWQLDGPLSPVVKPGGHGVLWKLARDEGVLAWFKEHNRTAALIRQISNPMSATDSTLLALSGMGQTTKKAMGFATCERKVGATEGMNVLSEQQRADSKWEYGVINIEYTDFERMGVPDQGVTPESSLSKFPTNTNILYVGLGEVQAAMQKDNGRAALPGMLVNLTKKV